MDRADLDYLIDGIVNGLSGVGFGGRNGNAGSSRPQARGKKFTIDDFEEQSRKYKEQIGEIETGQKRTRDAVDKDITKNLEEQLRLEEEIKDTLEERADLQEKLDEGKITDDELKRLDELIDKEKELTEVRREGLSLSRERANSDTKFGQRLKTINNYINGFKTMYNEAKKLAEPWAKIDQAAADYGRTLGMTGKAYQKFRDDTIKNVTDNKVAADTGLKQEELVAAQMKFASQTGRNISVDNEAQLNVGLIKKISGDKGLDFAAQLDKFGIGLTDAAEITADMYNDAVKSGLSFEEISSNVSKNLNVAQNYTFKNGIKGLESMAKKAAAIKLDIQQVANLAEKVSSVEGAVQTSAKLQVLGGPFAQMADPMGMLNEGLNDMEGLYDRVSKMIGGLGGFNNETGEVEVSSFNKRRIRAAAEAMGMDYSSLMESVNTQARRNEVSKQVASNSALSGLDKETQDLLINQASFKDGKAGVSINGEFKDLESLAGTDAAELKEMLKAQATTESEDLKSIVSNTRGAKEQTEAMNAQMEATQSKGTSWLGKLLKRMEGWVAYMPIIHAVLLAIQAASSVMNTVNAFRGGRRGRGLGRNLFRGRANGAANAVRNGGGWFSRAGNSIRNFGGRAFSGLKNVGGKVFGGIKNVGGKVFSGIKNVGGKVFSGIKNVGGKALGGLKSVGGKALGGLKSVGGKIGLKAGAKSVGILGKLGKAAAAGGGIASVATVAGALGDIGTDALVASGKIKKGGAAHHALSAGSNALAGAGTGAMIGSMFGPVGTAVGAVVGGVAGAVKGLWKSGAIQQAYKGVKKFAKKSWNKIKNSKVGKAIGKGINKIKNSKFGKAVGNAVNKFKKSKVGKAIGKAIEYSPIGLMAKGFKKLFGSDKKKKKKTPPPPKARSNSLDLLNKYTAKVKPVMEKGMEAKAGEVAKANKDIHLKTDPQDINLNGTLNLKGENGQSIDLMAELKNNPQMKRQLADMLQSEMDVIGKNGYVATGV